MASGALPPAFSDVEIDGQHYWDGGLVSTEACGVEVYDFTTPKASRPAKADKERSKRS